MIPCQHHIRANSSVLLNIGTHKSVQQHCICRCWSAATPKPLRLTEPYQFFT